MSPGELAERQQALRDMLGRLERGMRDMGMNPGNQFGGARDAMERAEQALRGGNLDGATEQQAQALEQLRQAGREMAQQMMRQMPSPYGMTGQPPELDPLGRPPSHTDLGQQDPGTGVKVPDQIDMQRAREILEELRRRLGEQMRPPVELDYLERLLKRF